MERKYNGNLLVCARNLRKNMTKEERRLWYDFLRSYHIRFVRQKIIGRYIADFYCAKAKIVIELDGSQHYEDEAKENDEKRTEYFASFGIAVVRIQNSYINNNFGGVCEYIANIIEERLGIGQK